MFVARREKRSASQTSGAANSMGSTTGSTAGHGTTAKQVNSTRTLDETAHPSQARAGVALGFRESENEAEHHGPEVTMVSTAASSHSPMSAGTNAMVAALRPGRRPEQGARQRAGKQRDDPQRRDHQRKALLSAEQPHHPRQSGRPRRRQDVGAGEAATSSVSEG